jgi:uncharacterized phage protein (TIGR01671 family)
MREIKFRAWDKGNQKMLYQDKHHFSIRLRGRGFEGNEVYIEHSNWIDNFFTPVQGTLMQYTGLKDKNGKEIYEGDILLVRLADAPDWEEDKIKGLIKWGTYTAGFTLVSNLGGKSVGGFRISNPYISTIAEMPDGRVLGDVIGNIYENPELLDMP